MNEDWKKTADNMELCLRNFYGSETFKMLKKLPWRMWLEVEDFSSFNLNNTKIWAVLDCSFRTEDEGVKLIEYNLFTNHGSKFNVSGAEIKNAKVHIAGSIADMHSLLVDVGENVPKEEEAFQKVEDERVKAGCNFRKVCG